jgi:RNA polymerase sigma factor (sigma-70 family)
MLSPDQSFCVPSISRDMRSLYDAHFAFVWRYMAHRGVPIVGVDDLVLNVFRIVREHPSRHDPARARSGLVCMISRQVLRDHRKRHSVTPGEGSEEGDGPTMAFSRHAAGQVLDAVLEGMTETQREVLLLSQGENMSNRDIADALGVPEAVVQQRLEAAAKLMTTLVAKLRMHPLWEALPKTSRDARALLDAAQRARTPTDADRERVFAAMLANTLAGGAAAVGGGRPPTELVTMPVMPMTPMPAPEPMVIPSLSQLETQEIVSTRKDRRPLIWGAVAFAAIAMGIGGYAINSWMYSGGWQAKAAAQEQMETATGTAQGELTPEPEQQQQAAVEAPAPAAEAPEAQPEPVAQVAAMLPEPTPAKARARGRASVRFRHTDGSDEPRQLFAAERAYRLGETKLALDMLNDLERQYPQSQYETERNALRAQVLCGRGRAKAARRVILELEADHADAPMLASVEKACSQQE